MTVGETLSEARTQAGLTIDELSERTKIRGTVIRSIERDDFEACGGDLYARGYMRAIAGAIGIDAQPLIREFDRGKDGQDGAAAPHAPVASSEPPPAAAQTVFDLPIVPETPVGGGGEALDATRFDLPVASIDPATTAYDLPAVHAVPPTAALPVVPPAAPTAQFPLVPPALLPVAEPVELAGPDEPAGSSEPATGSRRGLAAVAVLIVVIAAGALAFHFATGSTATKNAAATTVPSSAAASAASASAAARASASAAAKASAAAQASESARASASAAAKDVARHVTTLTVASVAAYGPDGLGDGDNPGNAGNAIARHASTPWTTQWYVTPDFGMLKHGTGLLLDLGGKVTVSSVRLVLPQYHGTDLQIRVGNGAVLGDLRVAAKANNAAGEVSLTLSRPAAGRYLLIWITQLPPDGAGHYQASVANVVVTGRR
ncbi:MAG: helix-turn-helix domain-containing protein [Trebonia sp.]